MPSSSRRIRHTAGEARGPMDLKTNTGGVMKQRMNFLILLLALFGWASVSAEETVVKVAGDRQAVIQFTDGSAGDPELSGSAQGASDLKAGKGGFRADLTLHENSEFVGSQFDFYSKVTGQTIEAIGALDLVLPHDPEMPKTLNLDFESKTEGDQSAANFSFDMTGVNSPEAVPSGNGKFKMQGDFKAFTSTGEFSLSGEGVQVDDLPFTSFELSVTEVEDKTTIKLKVVAPKDSETAQQMAALPMMAAMLEQQLQSGGIKYENLNFPAPTEEGEDSVSTAELTLIDLRGTIRPFLGMAAMQMRSEYSSDVDAEKALADMLEARFDEFTIGLAHGETSLNGNLVVNMSQLNRFYDGYLTLLPALNDLSNQDLIYQAGEFGPLVEAFLELNTQQSIETIKLLVNSELTFQGEMSVDLMPADNQEFGVKLAGNLLMNRYADFVTKARAAGLPVADKAVGLAKLTFKTGDDQTHNLVGELYAYTDGNLVDHYKTMLADAAAKADAPPEVKEAVSSLTVEDVSMKVGLRDNKVTLEGRSDTSDLSKIVSLILGGAAPQFQGELTGMAFSMEMPEPGQGTIDMKFHFADFFPGQNEAQIREALGLPGATQVIVDAPADEVKLVAVVQPELTIDGKLAEAKRAGEALLAASPGDVASGTASSGGGMKGLIGVGLLLFLGVIGFALFGRKSS